MGTTFLNSAPWRCIFRSALANLFPTGQWKGETPMSNPNQQESQRVLSRMGARILTPEEIAQVNGSQNQTFVFTHVIFPDTTKD